MKKAANNNDTPECEVEYLEFIESAVQAIEALLADPLDETARENAAAIVRSVREE